MPSAQTLTPAKVAQRGMCRFHVLRATLYAPEVT